MMKTTTLYDVASAAGVSYQTVSRVINQAEHVSARTREKVQQAMADMNYVPNRGAQLLAGKQLKTLGLVSTDLALHAPSQIASAVKTRAAEQGYTVLIAMVTRNDEAECRAAIQELQAQRVEGLLINVPLEDDAAARLQALAAPRPTLFLDVGESAPVNRLVFDARQGSRLGVSHLMALGHQHIALLAGPLSSVSARARLEGWQQALAEGGLTACAQAVGDWSAQSGYEKAHSLLAASPRPQAILVANDQMALGVLRACAEKGVRVPGQLSVVGYDDTTDSAWFSPPLTTVRQAFRHAGEQSVDWLIARDRHSVTCYQVCLPVTLVVRYSTAPHAETTDDDLARRLQALACQAARGDLR